LNEERLEHKGSRKPWQAPALYGWSAHDGRWRRRCCPPDPESRDPSEEVGPDEAAWLDALLVRLAIDRLPAAVFLLDKQGTVVEAVGAEAKKLTGDAGAVGRSLDELFEDEPDAHDALRRGLRGQIAAWSGPLGRGWYDFRIAPLLDAAGESVVVAGLAIDVTAQHRTEVELRARGDHLAAVSDGVALAFAEAVELREPYMAGHQRRVAELAVAVARRLRWQEPRIANLKYAALLHDVGRLSGPAELLARPEAIPSSQWPLVEAHCAAAAAMLRDVPLGSQVVGAIRQHHERLDGSGYPQGLRAADILSEARILAVADVVEAMSAPRPYRPAWGLEAVLATLEAGRGRLFDENVVEACVEVLEGRVA
jgi:HD-GYP domain-containing protein (c-di-GMP phosphodiesterase class II)